MLLRYLKYLFITSILIIAGCDNGAEVEMTCTSLREIEHYQIISRNKINAMNEEHSSEMMQSALINADYAIDIIQKELSSNCN